MQIVSVDIADHPYQVHIGAQLPITGIIHATLAAHGGVDQFIVLVDQALVEGVFYARVCQALENFGRCQQITIPSGEGSKSLSTYGEIIEQILHKRITRDTVVVNVGGGVTGDLGGFIAASALRGVRFVQIPTTLLSQIDSSVGGKVGINATAGKNLIGAFHQPIVVIADLQSLETLSPEIFAAGMAEIIKAGLLADADFVDWLEINQPGIAVRDTAILTHMIARAVQIKVDIVQDDTTERTGRRALLNLGHTFAHGLETLMGYDASQLSHGQAVGIGIVMAARLSKQLGMISRDDARRIEYLIKAYRLPHSAQGLGNRVTPQSLWQAMQFDKKNDGRGLKMVLLQSIGQAVIQSAPDVALIQKVIAENMRINQQGI